MALPPTNAEVRNLLETFFADRGIDPQQFLRSIHPEMMRTSIDAAAWKPPSQIGFRQSQAQAGVITLTITLNDIEPFDNVVRSFTFEEDGTSGAETIEVRMTTPQGNITLFREENGAVFPDTFIIGADNGITRAINALLPVLIPDTFTLLVILERPVAGQLGGEIHALIERSEAPWRPRAI